MEKRIAVFVCAISFSNQRKIIEGILEEAGKADMEAQCNQDVSKQLVAEVDRFQRI